MSLKVRVWACPKCGSLHDWLINAAPHGLVVAVSVRGEAVSPVFV